MSQITEIFAKSDRFTLQLFFGAFAAFLLGNLTHSLAPIFVGALISGLNVPGTKAGLLVSVEFGGIALTAILIGPLVARISKRRLAVFGCACALSAHVVSTFVSSYDILIWIRFFAGLGTGTALAAGGAAVAMSVTPDRLFALIKSLSALAMALILMLGGYSVKWFGISGGFGLLAIFFLLALPLLFLLPGESAVKKKETERESMPAIGMGSLTIAGLLIWMGSSGLCFAFATKIGEASGLDIQRAGLILGISFLFGIGGGLVAAWLGLRAGRSLPLFAGIIVNAITWWLVCVVPHPLVYTVCITLNSIAYFFTLPYILGTAAALDRQGRWAAIASTLILAAMAVSPSIGGWIYEQFGISRLGATTLAGELVALGLLLIVVNKASFSGSATASPATSQSST